MDETLHASPILKFHEQASAVLGEEGGWQVPVSYGAPLEEARQVRRQAGIFDLTHLGRIRIRDDGALNLLERVCTHDVAHQEDDTAQPTLLCNERGGILDQAVLIRLSSFWVLVTSPGNRRKILDHLQAQAVPAVRVDDQSFKVAHFAVMGPAARDILVNLLPVRIDDLSRGEARMGSLMVANYIAVRVGYAGLWSLEVMVPNMFAAQAWSYVTQKHGEQHLPPAGMAARDVLRIEACLPRYGHEISEAVDPFTAGLEDLLDFNHDFLGSDALAKMRGRGPQRRVYPWVGPNRPPQSAEEIPRLGDPVLDAEGGEIGTVTSGTFSPKHEALIGLAAVAADRAVDGAEIRIAARTGEIAARLERR